MAYLFRSMGSRLPLSALVTRLTFHRSGGSEMVDFDELEPAEAIFVDDLPPGDWRWGMVRYQIHGDFSLSELAPLKWVTGCLVKRTPESVSVRYLPGLRDLRHWTGGTFRVPTLGTWRAIRGSIPSLPDFRTPEELTRYLQDLEPA